MQRMLLVFVVLLGLAACSHAQTTLTLTVTLSDTELANLRQAHNLAAGVDNSYLEGLYANKAAQQMRFFTRETFARRDKVQADRQRRLLPFATPAERNQFKAINDAIEQRQEGAGR